MADYTFFFNPESRAQIARWALHEAGADYAGVMVPWDAKPQALLDANPMGKLPTIIHHHAGEDGGRHDHVVTEAAAICHYLAEMEATDLLPGPHEKAAYFRWLFFAAGPVEQAVTAKALGWEPQPEQEIMAGFGSFDRTIDTLDGWLAAHDWVCGDRFTMADVYVGSAVDWGLMFGTMPERASFLAYRDRYRKREAYQAGMAIDNALIEDGKRDKG